MASERIVERIELCGIAAGERPYFRIVYVDRTERTIAADDPDVELQVAAAMEQPS